MVDQWEAIGQLLTPAVGLLTSGNMVKTKDRVSAGIYQFHNAKNFEQFMFYNAP